LLKYVKNGWIDDETEELRESVLKRLSILEKDVNDLKLNI
jgi:hypothetical protein